MPLPIALRLRCCCMAAALLHVAPASAEPQVYVDGYPPLAYVRDGVMQGVSYDLLQEMARRVGHVGPIQPVPLKREQALLLTRHDTLGTLCRFPEMEESYAWWFKLQESRFVMAASSASRFDLSSIQAASDLRVGVILGSPAEMFARRSGFKHIDTVGSIEANANKLALGRIDVWIASANIIAAGQAKAGKSMGDLRIGPDIGGCTKYLASSRRFDPVEAGKWKAAFEAMKRDGTYARLTDRYGQPPSR